MSEPTLPRTVGGYLSLALILAALSVPAYALGMLFLLILPPVLVVATLSDPKGERPSGPLPPVPERLFLALVVVPLVLLAVLAPLRALLLAAFGTHPSALRAFHEAHAPLYGPLEALFGGQAVPWLDAVWGLYGAAAVLALAIFDVIRRGMLARQVENLATARIRSVAVGLAELKGRAVPCPGAPPGAALIRFWMERKDEGWSTRTQIDPFLLDDGTGTILVDARGADIGTRSNLFAIALHQVKLRHLTGDNGMPEQRLMPGDELYVLGRVQINDGADREASPLVVRPRRTSWARLDVHDLFFVGHGDEPSLLRDFRRAVLPGWIVVILLMAACLWLSAGAWRALMAA